MSDPIRIPVRATHDGDPSNPHIVISPDLARQIVALAQESRPAKTEYRPCPDCGSGVLGDHRIQYHKCEPTPVNDLLAEAATPGTAPQPAAQGDEAKCRDYMTEIAALRARAEKAEADIESARPLIEAVVGPLIADRDRLAAQVKELTERAESAERERDEAWNRVGTRDDADLARRMYEARKSDIDSLAAQVKELEAKLVDAIGRETARVMERDEARAEIARLTASAEKLEKERDLLILKNGDLQVDIGILRKESEAEVARLTAEVEGLRARKVRYADAPVSDRVAWERDGGLSLVYQEGFKACARAAGIAVEGA